MARNVPYPKMEETGRHRPAEQGESKTTMIGGWWIAPMIVAALIFWFALGFAVFF